MKVANNHMRIGIGFYLVGFGTGYSSALNTPTGNEFSILFAVILTGLLTILWSMYKDIKTKKEATA